MKRQELYLLLALIGLAAGTFLSAFLTFISPLPIIFAFRKFGRKVAYIIIILAGVLVGAVAGVSYGFAFLVVAGIISVVIGLQIEGKSFVNVRTLVVRSMYVIFTFYFVIGGIFFLSDGSKKIKTISSSVETHIDTLYKTVSVEPSILGLNGKIYKGKNSVKEYLTSNVVSFFILALMAIVIINILFLTGMFPEVLKRNDLFTWRVPSHFIWVPLFCGFIVVISQGKVLVFFENIFRIALFPYFYQGVAVVAFFLSRKKLPALFYVMVIFAISTFLILPSTVVGFIDNWINFRKPGKISGGVK